jgi:hypothetical protein
MSGNIEIAIVVTISSKTNRRIIIGSNPITHRAAQRVEDHCPHEMSVANSLTMPPILHFMLQ